MERLLVIIVSAFFFWFSQAAKKQYMQEYILSHQWLLFSMKFHWFSSPGFLRFAMIPDIVWVDFSVSDLKFNYIGPRIIK